MAIHLIILGLMFAIVIGLFVVASFTEIKIFIPLAFIFLAFSGLFVTIGDGIIIDQRVSSIDALGVMTYEDVIITTEDPVVLLFSMGALWFGIALTIFSSLAIHKEIGAPSRGAFNF